jgi:hypothetical protein
MFTAAPALGTPYRHDPVALLQRAQWRGTVAGWRARLTGASRRLQSLPRATHRVEANRHYAGLQVVRLSQVRGTESRGTDFDRDFYPLSERTDERWLSICRVVQAGRVLPPVELLKLGGENLVRDGHHRISVARALGQVEIEAHVTIWD